MTNQTARPRKDRKPPAPPKRRAKGFAHAADLTAPMLKQAGAKRGFAELRLLTEWRAIVGDALASVCRPIKVTYKGRTSSLGATLFVATEGARAPELAMQEPQIIERVNRFYGYRAISRLSIDQSRSDLMARPAGSAGFAESADPYRPDHPVQAQLAKNKFEINDVEDDGLRQALARLGANISARSDRPSRDATAPADRSTK